MYARVVQREKQESCEIGDSPHLGIFISLTLFFNYLKTLISLTFFHRTRRFFLFCTANGQFFISTHDEGRPVKRLAPSSI